MRSTDRTRRRLAVFAVALLALVAAGSARADGDPASDVLYSGRVFFSYGSISQSTQDALTTTVKRAETAGYPIRVALIASREDLGAVTALWAKPREYAKFLDLELSIAYRGPLLIVMPQGIGFAHYKRSTAREERTLSGVKVEGGHDGLVRTAVAAVSALARSSGHPITPVVAKAGSSSHTVLWAGIGAGVFVALAAAFFVLRYLRPAR
jgi:hypothetical protein